MVAFVPTMKSLDSDKKPSGIPKTKDAVVEEKIDFSKVKVEPLFEEYVDFETFSKSDFRAVKVKACEAVKKSKKLLQFTLDDGTGTDRTILSGIHAYYEPEELVGKTLIALSLIHIYMCIRDRDFNDKEYIFGGTALEREKGSELTVTYELTVDSGTARLYWLDKGEEKMIVDTSKNGTYSVTLDAVSYTHLDVYKRQTVYGACWMKS